MAKPMSKKEVKEWGKKFVEDFNKTVDDYKNYAIQRRVLLEYLQVMIALEDWHGVSDAANDLRELDAKNKAGEK